MPTDLQACDGGLGVLRLFVPSEPQGWQRPGVQMRGRHPRLYTQQKTAAYEACVAQVAGFAAARQRWTHDGAPLRLEATMLHRRPRSTPPGHPCRGHSGRAWLTKKPDVDNVAKAVLDGLVRGGVIADDIAVCELVCRQFWAAKGEDPGVHIEVSRLRPWADTPQGAQT